jgi:uncharacterized coiled-coil DUF342 family protein
VYLEESTVQKMREKLTHKDEIMMDALRKRDAHKQIAQEYKDKLTETRVQLAEANLRIETLNKDLVRLSQENKDLEGFNRMLQQTIKRIGTKKAKK